MAGLGSATPLFQIGLLACVVQSIETRELRCTPLDIRTQTGQYSCKSTQCSKEVIMRQTTGLTLIGKALSHPLRERMLWLLADGERCGGEFAPRLGVDPSIVSRYLAVLERAGLVTSRRDGVRVMWSLANLQILDLLEKLTELTAETVA